MVNISILGVVLILNLVVDDGFRDVHNSKLAIRNVVRFVRSSSHRLGLKST